MGLTGQLLSQASFSDPAPQALGLHPFPEESWGCKPSSALHSKGDPVQRGGYYLYMWDVQGCRNVCTMVCATRGGQRTSFGSRAVSYCGLKGVTILPRLRLLK